ncbi:hypothetical protein FOCC_FOCC014078 [Frankliniella occidentalis]|nr:hypothetical protein FOCC_FOCC014078 [Frankliniella occidentalis]
MYGGQNASSSGGGGGGGPPGDSGSGGGGPPADGGSGDGSGGGGNSPDGFGDAGSAWVLREMPLWIKKRYETDGRKLPVFITENGVNSAGNASAVDDWDTRAVYASAFLRELAAGINENGTNVIGYTAWSFIDTFEFHSMSNWGMVHVDFNSTGLERTLKNSWTFFKRVMKTRVVPLVEAGSQPFPDDDSTSTTTTTSTTARTSGATEITSSAALAVAAFLIALRIN